MAFFQAQHVWVEEAGDGVATLVLDAPGKANHLNRTVLEELDQALIRIEAEPRFQLCVLSSKKTSSFCHGAAAAAFKDLQTPDAWEAFSALGQRVCDRLTQLRTPTVALIAGACLGGGLELALACDWRVAVDKPVTQLGFTELEWGLAPSWGGIGRILHLAGLERGLHMLLGDKKLSAREAQRWGLVDELVKADSSEPPLCVRQARKRTAADRPRRTWRQRLLESIPWGRRLMLRAAERVLRRRVPDDMPAPWELLAAIRVHIQHGDAAAKEHVHAAMGRLGTSAACRNLLRLKLLHEERRAADAALPRPKNIGILGATPLALHLATQAAVKGCHVVLREKDELTLGMASLRLVKTLQDEVTHGAMTEEMFKSNVNRIRPTVSWKGFDELELVIDATHGAVEAEQRLLRELESQVPPEAVIACVRPWRALAGWQPLLHQPGRAVGMHFPPPVGRSPLVEVLAAPATSEHAIRCVRGFAAMLGKTTVVAQEPSGGLVQRVVGAGINEALHLLHEGHPPERLEHAMHRFGMVYGLLELVDWLGVDEIVLSADRLSSALGESAAEHPVVQHLIEQRWLGVKSGIGFYRHRGSTQTPNRALSRWLRRSFAQKMTPMSAAEHQKHVQMRLIGRMVNEAFRCLGDGVVSSSVEIDLALMLVGWAPHRGGPCRYAEQTGYAATVEMLEQLAQRHGPRYAACSTLRRMSNS